MAETITRVRVRNEARNPIERAGVVFPGRQEQVVDIPTSRLKEVTACVHFACEVGVKAEVTRPGQGVAVAEAPEEAETAEASADDQDLSELPKTELQRIAEELDLPVSGNKAEIAERIREARAEASEEGEPGEEAETAEASSDEAS